MDSMHAPLSHTGIHDVGVLVLHGFTGSPHSVRGAAEFFVQHGYSVEMPLLPGHGTSWQDMAGTVYRDWVAEADRAYWRLAQGCSRIVVFGLSMGGTLALHIAARLPVAGLILVNPFVLDTNPLMRWAHLLAPVVRSVPAVGNDIKRPGANEHAYARTPTASVRQLHLLGKEVRRTIPSITAPLLIFRSENDHLIGPASVAFLENYAQTSKTVCLSNSFHVATLDYDAPQIFSQSLEFIRELVRTPA